MSKLRKIIEILRPHKHLSSSSLSLENDGPLFVATITNTCETCGESSISSRHTFSVDDISRIDALEESLSEYRQTEDQFFDLTGQQFSIDWCTVATTAISRQPELIAKIESLEHEVAEQNKILSFMWADARPERKNKKLKEKAWRRLESFISKSGLI